MSMMCISHQKSVSSQSHGQELSEDQLQFYRDNGYLVIRNLFDTPFLNLLRAQFVKIVNKADASSLLSIVKDHKLRGNNRNPEMYINKIHDILYDPVFSLYTEHYVLLKILSQLLGPEITAVNSMLINKPPGTRPHPIHQDLYYFPIRPADKMVGVWTAIDPVREDNGCLYVVPGSHKIETLYLQGTNSKDNIPLYYGILKEDIVAPQEKRVHLMMEPGDTVLLHPYLVHGSGANTTQSCRKSMTAHFASSSCHYIDIRGTPSELLTTALQQEARRRGFELIHVEDVWRMKCKPVKGPRSNL